jgi:hypothetical protein
VTEFIPKLRQKADEFLTNYLRDTTTDQEILDFYGEGNIIGRKGKFQNMSMKLLTCLQTAQQQGVRGK